jgi:hypothetical protein
MRVPERLVRAIVATLVASAGLVGLASAAPAFAAPVRMGGIAAGLNHDGRLEVFSLGVNGAVYHNWQTSAGGGWSGWASLGAPAGGLVNGPSAAVNTDGRLEIFAVSTSAVYHNWQTSPGGGWSGWSALGSFTYPSGVGVGTNADGRLEVFITAGGVLYASWQVAPGAGWSAWANHGTPPLAFASGKPAVARNVDGRLEVAVLTTQNHLWHLWQTSAGGGWSGWAGFGVCRTTGDRSPVLVANRDGRLEVFVTSPSYGENRADLCHRWQTSPGAGWSGWSNRGGDLDGFAPIAVVPNADGRLEVFGRNAAGVVMSSWQVTPGGGWSGWVQRSGSGYDTSIGAARNRDGRLEAFAFRAGQPYHAWQISAGGGWSAWGPLEAS